MFNPDRMIIINLYSGKYTEHQEGNEKRNLRPELDGRYYGYCPPYDNIDIYRNFNCKKNDEYVDDILVVYIKEADGKCNKQIIAFAPSARLYAKPRPRTGAGIFADCPDNANLTYSIRSDTLYDLEKMGINDAIFNTNRKKNIFRAQKIYGHKFHDIAMDIIMKLNNILYDEDTKQSDVLDSAPAPKSVISNSHKAELKTFEGSLKVRKNPSLAKAALEEAEYKCQIDSSHETFKTAKGFPYMEGHHLIPCSYRNAKNFMEMRHRNLDCFVNIICLCPTCHRAIHYGDEETKNRLISTLYAKKRALLAEIGLDIGEDQLHKLYEID